MSWLCDDDVNGTIKINKFKKKKKRWRNNYNMGPMRLILVLGVIIKKKNSNFLKKTKEKKTVDVKGSVS